MTDKEFEKAFRLDNDLPIYDEARRARSEESRLKAENERLREALEKIQRIAKTTPQSVADVVVAETARAALSIDKQGPGINVSNCQKCGQFREFRHKCKHENCPDNPCPGVFPYCEAGPEPEGGE